MERSVHFHGLCVFNIQVKRSGGKAHLAIRAFFSWPITGPYTSAIAQYFHWTPTLILDKTNSSVRIVLGPVWDDYQGAHTYYQHKWFDKKINVTIKKQKKKKEDSWLSNELSNMMEISLLCYIKAYGTTEYYVSFFKTILDSSKDWEEWIAANEGFSERREAKVNRLNDITFSLKKV